MASSVATPLERQFGHIAAVSEMTSVSSLGQSSVTLQFDLDRGIDAAARGYGSCGHQCGARLSARESAGQSRAIRKVNRTDLAHLHPRADFGRAERRDRCTMRPSTVMAQKLSQITGVGQVTVGGSALFACRVELNPDTPE